MNNKAFLNIYKNPIIIFGLITLILTAILYSGTHFEFPDYYTNRVLADKLAQDVMPYDVEKTVKSLINPLYKIYNFLYHIWAIFIALFIFCVIFRIYKFSSYKDLKIFSNKLFVYIWANLSYIIFGICSYYSAIAEIKKYVYNGMADSFGIIYLVKVINKAETIAKANGLSSIDEILIKEAIQNETENSKIDKDSE